MKIQHGLVIAKDGDKATVEIYKNPNCITCDKKSKHGACINCSDYDENGVFRAVALNNACAEVGDSIIVAPSKRQKVLLSIVSFVIPMLCAFIAYFCVSVFTDAERVKSSVAIMAFVIAMIFAAVYSYKISKNSCDYKIVKII